MEESIFYTGNTLREAASKRERERDFFSSERRHKNKAAGERERNRWIEGNKNWHEREKGKKDRVYKVLLNAKSEIGEIVMTAYEGDRMPMHSMHSL